MKYLTREPKSIVNTGINLGDNTMGDLRRIVQQRKDYKKIREDQYKVDSKERLSKILKKKIQTTMIGALSSVEEHFAFLWENCATEDQKKFKELYDQVRSEILDKGNHQARNIDAELAQYEVNWLKYHLQIPVVPQQEIKDE
jgi:hypothetical protein